MEMLERIHKFGCCGTAMLEMARNLRSITSQLYEDRVTSMSFSVKFITMGDQEFAINQLKEERQVISECPSHWFLSGL